MGKVAPPPPPNLHPALPHEQQIDPLQAPCALKRREQLMICQEMCMPIVEFKRQVPRTPMCAAARRPTAATQRVEHAARMRCPSAPPAVVSAAAAAAAARRARRRARWRGRHGFHGLGWLASVTGTRARWRARREEQPALATPSESGWRRAIWARESEGKERARSGQVRTKIIQNL